MPLNPGSLTLTFNPPDRFAVDQYHSVPASTGLTSFSQPGCAKQTANVKDKVNDTAYAEATDKVFTPFNTNIDGVQAEWEIIDGSTTLRILGAHRTADAYGRIFQCEFICKQESG
jgi:NADPH-dependent glutamate synthase beta subunit-like oxidoreductase